MKVGAFNIVCTKCGSEKVKIAHYHNRFEEGIRIECVECNAKVEL
jgi:DNA-directed RNA polymerase subunit RPC12/RpoP